MPSETCVLCSRRLKIHQRRPVNKVIAKYLRKNFLLETTNKQYICGRCSRYAYEGNTSNCPSQPSSSQQTDVISDTPSGPLCQGSPPSINLKIRTATKSHAYCFICKKPGPKLVNVPAQVRTDVFIKHNILITSGSRCCPRHFQDSTLSTFEESAISDLCTVESTFVNRSTVLALLNTIRQSACSSANNRLSFDNLALFSEDDILNLTGIGKADFEDLLQCVQPKVRQTPARSAATTLGIFLFKLKSGLSNKILATLFNISKSSIRRAFHSTRKILSTDFVPLHLGFQHISREEVITQHTRLLAQNLLTENPDQAILVLDGTYIYIQKSGNFKFQRSSYSLHKGRPLVKPMVIVTTSGYFVSVIGPYLANPKNNDASILTHIFRHNIEEIKSWVHQNDIFVVDRGFRDAINLLDDLGINAKIPAFLYKGKRQLSTEQANASRIVTKVCSV